MQRMQCCRPLFFLSISLLILYFGRITAASEKNENTVKTPKVGESLIESERTTSESQVRVVTIATEETDGLKRLLKSAERFDIRVEVFGLGQEWRGGDTRIEQVTNLSSYSKKRIRF